MSRRANSHVRCNECRLHLSLCVCSHVPTIQTRTRLVLVIHRAEDRKSTNTGRLATLCLPNSETWIRGHQETPTPPYVASPDTQPLLLFPAENAQPIADFAACKKPITLIVPDGNWRQASKVRNRVAGLDQIPCVTLPKGEPSIYRLRFEAHEGGLATMEAVARAMGVLEGEAVQRELERIFRMMVERTLWARGRVDTPDVTGGIPDGVERHEPRGFGRGEKNGVS